MEPLEIKKLVDLKRYDEIEKLVMRASEIKKLPDDKKEVALQIYAGLTDQVKHLNTMQNNYRTFMSAWILASFAGLASTISIKETAHWICGLSIGGVIMFGIIDYAYHRLLKAVLEEQEKMEIV